MIHTGLWRGNPNKEDAKHCVSTRVRQTRRNPNSYTIGRSFSLNAL